MKVSEAILKGMERFPKQAFGRYQKGNNAACAIGCANWTITGYTLPGHWPTCRAEIKFYDEYRVSPQVLGDYYRFPRDVIAGMFAAIGE